ncbi:hypothetical protein [Janthinobacterium sp. BJB304]|uniref:hypothetical protein n=1 Tax=Janthinobacterium sp. BJB304 TaxID=1572871 RepID=UPI000C0E1C75|nr:hypothetical protein [Janthinobacterium sp. BJB304]PHV36874.1 hypothetical protein CSQ95_21725 [Janthinobacterium sp. BJB304]
MTATMRIAFDAASGGTAAGVALVIGLALAAFLVVWGANAVRMLLIEVMHHPNLFARNGWLVMRVVTILMVFFYLLK